MSGRYGLNLRSIAGKIIGKFLSAINEQDKHRAEQNRSNQHAEENRLLSSLSIFFSMLVAAILLGAVLVLFIDRAQEFSDNLPRYRSKIQAVTGDISKRLLALEKKSEDFSKTIIPKTGKTQAKPLLVQQYSSWGDYLRYGFSAYLLQISFFPFLVYFLLIEKDSIRLFVTNMVRGRALSLTNSLVESTAGRIVNEVNNRIRGFVVGYLVSTIVLFAFAWIIFLAFQVEEALIWALVFALMNILPFLGAIFSVIPPIVIGVLQFTSIQKTLLLTGICLGFHLVYANWLIPRTTGRRTALSPLVVLISMMYWGFLWGPIGIFLAIPLTSIAPFNLEPVSQSAHAGSTHPRSTNLIEFLR